MSETKTYANPFPGLRPFETDEHRLFFGREGQSDALIERLQRAHFLAVVGTSGSGKSSLIRAGMLPALHGGMMAGAGAGWRIAVMRPGHDPIGNLAHELAADAVLADVGAGLPRAEAEAIVEATLRRGSLGLIDAARQARLGAHEKLLVVVDQFEELFRFRAARAATSTDDDAAAFVKLLLEASQQSDVPIYVVLTMRSDFLGDCAQFQGLPEAINNGQYLIPRMTRDERRFAIVGPVRVSRARISEPLVNRLLNDVGDNPDQLPILQHALMRTWDYWQHHRHEGEPIGIEHYEAVGTMNDALSRHADEAFNELPDERSRNIAEQLFRALTERGADNREIRRPTPLRELCNITGASANEVVAVIDIFRREGRSFLMPPEGVALKPGTVIDISHESLIRNWQRLREWVRDEAEAARIYRRLADAAVGHRNGEGGLLDEVTLGWVNRWREKYSPTRAWGVRYHAEYDEAMAYLEASRMAVGAAAIERERQRQEVLERERREREQAEAFAAEQQRAAQRQRRMSRVLFVVASVALAALLFAFAALKEARSNAKQAGQAKERLQLNRHALQMIQSYEMDKAEEELYKLYGMNSNDAEGREGKAWALYNLGELNRKLERYDQASAFFESALQTEIMVHGKLGTDSIGTLDSLARTLEAYKDYPVAVARYEQLADILSSVANQKDEHFKLNTANVHDDLANLYIEQALAHSSTARSSANEMCFRVVTGNLPTDLANKTVENTPIVDENTRRKSWQETMKATTIWEEVLKNDPGALAERYEQALNRFFYCASPGIPMQEYNALYYPTIEAIRKKRETLLNNITYAPQRQAIGHTNPGNDPDITMQLPPEGTGYTTFNRNPAGLYGRPGTVEFVKSIAASWAARHPNLKFVVGDISRLGGGNFPPHLDHQDGREVDIWAVSNSGVAEPTNIYAPNYSREMTKELIELIKQTSPNAVVYFDDRLLEADNLVKGTLDHDNYLHVLIP